MAEAFEYAIGAPMPGTKWVVRGKLGSGGMGVVLDVQKGGLIAGAMKVLHPSFARIPAFSERFLDEVRVTAQLQHPNIVQVLDFDRLADGIPYMVMERLRGRSLRAALRETRLRGKKWSPGNTYAVAAQVCEGLARAHSHTPAIVHRDVKPENIYLHRSEGRVESIVKIVDFGVAAVVGYRDPNQIGTPRYMAPEQLRGERISPQTDQYGLALVIYEMLTGRWPWEVDVRSVEAISRAHLMLEPKPPSACCGWLPDGADGAILKALAKRPGDRHDTVHQLLFELRGLQRASMGMSEVLSTDPMVGTVADGYAPATDDAAAKITVPALEGIVARIPELSPSALESSPVGAAEGSPHLALAESLPDGEDSGSRAAPSSVETSLSVESLDRAPVRPVGRARLRRVGLGAAIAACGVIMLTGATRLVRGSRIAGAVHAVETTVAAGAVPAAGAASSSPDLEPAMPPQRVRDALDPTVDQAEVAPPAPDESAQKTAPGPKRTPGTAARVPTVTRPAPATTAIVRPAAARASSIPHYEQF